MTSLRRHLDNITDGLLFMAERVACRLLGAHGRSCRGRIDHVTPRGPLGYGERVQSRRAVRVERDRIRRAVTRLPPKIPKLARGGIIPAPDPRWAETNPVELIVPFQRAWEKCTGCGREYAYPYLCREHMLCGLCHPEVTPR